MSKYRVNKTEDMWLVEDELGSVIDVCESRAQARDLVRELDKPAGNVHHIAGTYGNGDVDSEPVKPSSPVANETPVEPIAVIEIVDVQPHPNMTRNSDQVRYRIGIAKQRREPQSAVVQWAIDKLGMKKPLASTYVKGNWDRV